RMDMNCGSQRRITTEYWRRVIMISISRCTSWSRLYGKAGRRFALPAMGGRRNGTAVRWRWHFTREQWPAARGVNRAAIQGFICNLRLEKMNVRTRRDTMRIPTKSELEKLRKEFPKGCRIVLDE